MAEGYILSPDFSQRKSVAIRRRFYFFIDMFLFFVAVVKKNMGTCHFSGRIHERRLLTNARKNK